MKEILPVPYKPKTPIFFWFHRHAGWCVWDTGAMAPDSSIYRVFQMLQRIILGFHGWWNVRLCLYRLGKDRSCMPFLPVEPFSHCGGEWWVGRCGGVLFSLGISTLISLSQRVSSDKVAVRVLSQRNYEKSSSTGEWKPDSKPGLKVLVWGQKKSSDSKELFCLHLMLCKWCWMPLGFWNLFHEMYTRTCQGVLFFPPQQIYSHFLCHLGLLDIYLKLDTLNSFNQN